MKKNDEEMRSGGNSGSSTANIVGSTGRHGHRESVGAKGMSSGVDAATDDKYKEINMRLRRLLTEERRALQSVRTNYAAELRSRTEMEILLRQCVDDVRKEISLRTISNHGSRPGSSGGPHVHSVPVTVPTSAFSQADRERSLELLLSQERVISLIYSRTFPINPSNKPKSAGVAPFGRTNTAENGIDSDILMSISMGLANNSNAENTRDNSYDGEGLSISEGGGGPLIAAALLNNFTHDMTDSATSRLPAI